MRVEAVTASDTVALNFNVGSEALGAGDDIEDFTGRHDLMEPNGWCGSGHYLFLYDQTSGVYEKVLYSMTPKPNVTTVTCP